MLLWVVTSQHYGSPDGLFKGTLFEYSLFASCIKCLKNVKQNLDLKRYDKYHFLQTRPLGNSCEKVKRACGGEGGVGGMK